MDHELRKALIQIESKITEWKYGVYRPDDVMDSISEIVNKYLDDQLNEATKMEWE